MNPTVFQIDDRTIQQKIFSNNFKSIVIWLYIQNEIYSKQKIKKRKNFSVVITATTIAVSEPLYIYILINIYTHFRYIV